MPHIYRQCARKRWRGTDAWIGRPCSCTSQGEQGDAGGNCKTPVEWPALFTCHSNPEKPLSSAKMWSAVTQVVLRDRNHSANGPNRKQLSRDDTLLPISHPRGVQIRLGSCQCRGEYPAEFQF